MIIDSAVDRFLSGSGIFDKWKRGITRCYEAAIGACRSVMIN